GQRVAEQARDVDERQIEGVAAGAGQAGLLAALQFLEHTRRAAGRARRALAGAAGAERGGQFLAFALVALGAHLLGLVVGGLDQRVGGGIGRAGTGGGGGEGQRALPAFAGVGVGGQAAGTADVTAADRGRP